MAKPVILGLHGYMQDGDIYRSRIGSVRRIFKSRAEFAFLDGPYPAATAGTSKLMANVLEDLQARTPTTEITEVPGRSWWTWADEVDRPSQAKTYRGVGQSLKDLSAALHQHSPVGVIAFSQGAALMAILLAMAQPRANINRTDAIEVQAFLDEEMGAGWDETLPPLPRFVVLVGGFLANDDRWAEVVKARGVGVGGGLRVLCVSGEKDELVVPEKSRALWACMEEQVAEWWPHPGGHMVPTGGGEFKVRLRSLWAETVEAAEGAGVAVGRGRAE